MIINSKNTNFNNKIPKNSTSTTKIKYEKHLIIITIPFNLRGL